MSETLTDIGPTLVPPPAHPPNRKKGTAQRIRKLKLRHPELSDTDIAKTVGTSRQNVSCVLATFLADRSDTDLRDYQENQADIFDSLAMRLLASVTQEKLDKSKPMEAITGAAILIDKARLVRGQATGINVTALLDVAELIRQRGPAVGQPINPQAISGASD